MSLRCLSLLWATGLSAMLLVSAGTCRAIALRVCADPDNLPFSNQAGAGFDNRIAVLVAREMHRKPQFVWARSRRGFLRERFNKGACDVLMGVPTGMRGVAVSAPYYRSSYVFVTAIRDHLDVTRFDDPRLHGRKIGLQILDEDMAPPSLPLIRTGHAGQLLGFPSFGSQSGDVVRAVARGQVGAAVVWGPVAGYYAEHERLRLTLTPVQPEVDASGIPFVFDLAIGVHKEDAALLDQVNGALERLRPEIARALASYHVPVMARPAAPARQSLAEWGETNPGSGI